MPRTPTTSSGRPLDIYPHGRAVVRDLLHDVRHLVRRRTLADAITVAAGHHSHGDQALAHAAEADAVFLIAHAADPAIHQALDGRLPPLLSALDHQEPDRLVALITQAQQAATAVPILTASATSPRLPLTPADRTSWLHDNELRELLGAAVYTGLQTAELRFTGQETSDVWKPGTVPIAKALAKVAAETCSLAGLDHRDWQLFVEIQMAHVIARANELPPGAGPLDDRIPAYMAHLKKLEDITVADTLYIAHADFGYVLHDPPKASTSPRVLAASSRRASAPALSSDRETVTGTTRTPARRR
ncbi:hypothetical protein ACWEO1_08640 [Kitasatospora cineracea]